MKIKCMIDNLKYNNKPTGKEIGSIVNRLGREENVVEISVKELANKIIEGYSIKPAICGRKQDEWQEQQVFMVDVDDGLTIEQAINKSREIDIVPTFIYTSFSHTEKKHKFRLVFVVDEIITNIDEALAIKNILNQIFNGDEHCKNLNRIYFGGRSIVYENYNSVLNVENILKKYSEKLYDKNFEENPPQYNSINKYTNTIVGEKTPSTINYNIQAIKDKNIKYLQSVLNINKKTVFETRQDFYEYITKNIDLSELLGINNPSSFKCIFHNDNNPSAGIFKGDNGAYIYKCHSSSCGVITNIVGVIEILIKAKTKPQAYNFIKELYNLEIKETEWQKEQKEILEENLRLLRDGTLEEQFPDVYKLIKRNIHVLERLHLIAMDNIRDEKLTNEDGNVIFFASTRYITKQLGMSSNSAKEISKKLVLFQFLNLLNKHSEENLPESYYKKSRKMATTLNKKGKRVHTKHITYLSINSYIYPILQESQKMAQLWKDNNMSMAGLSRENILRTFGERLANILYPQYHYQNKKGTTKASNERTNDIVEIIFYLINSKNYATEKEIVEILKSKYGKTLTKVQIKRSLQEILDSYDLIRIRANKKIKEQYRVAENGYPFIIVKFDNYI